VFTFSLNSLPNGHADVQHGEATYNNVAVSENGVPQTAIANGVEFENGNSVSVAYGPITFRNLYVASLTLPETFLSVSQDPLSLVETVTFRPATYVAADKPYVPGGTLTITPAGAPTAVPEPGSVALLGTGMLGLVGAVRRRFSA
jgi:hypothetical protein